MHSKLFITLSAIALIGTSATALGEVITDTWIWYSKDGKQSRPTSDQVPQADCLETICEYGCVEKNNAVGDCCPGNGQCKVAGADVDLCCADDEYCKNGTCRKKTCSFGNKTYEYNASVGECGKCVNGSVIQDTAQTLPDCKSSCNTSTWNWNNATNGTKAGECGKCQNGEVVAVCGAGGDVPQGTLFDSKTMSFGQNCECNCTSPFKWTNQNQCCIPVERVDGTFDCESFEYKKAYNITASRARPYDKTEFSGKYTQAHKIRLKVNGVDDDLIVKVGNTSYGPFWSGCAAVASDGTNGRKLDRTYSVPANTEFELNIRDICPTNIGINYSISFDN